MFQFAYCVLLSAVLLGCDSNDRTRIPLVPDGTPFIVSTLEFSPDTLFSPPQVYVATLTDRYVPDDNNPYDLFTDGEHLPSTELWHPVQWSQVGWKLRLLRIQPNAVSDAEVRVTGPLGQAGEQSVTFVSTGRGSYTDVARTLTVLPEARYRLHVRLPDGRTYRSETTVPRPASLTIPDTLRIPTEIGASSGPGSYNEIGVMPVEWAAPPGAILTVWGFNHSLSHDRELWGLQEGEEFPYQDRGNYLRSGAHYSISTNSNSNFYIPTVSWSWPITTPVYEAQIFYTRLYIPDEQLSRYFVFQDDYGVPEDDPFSESDLRLLDARRDRDTTYFPSISNIHRVGADGQTLPLAQSDAVGVFGAYSARYMRRVKIPVRNFDPDTLDFTPRPAAPVSPRPPARSSR